MKPQAATLRLAGLAALLSISGTLHLVKPAGFVTIVPRSLPNPEFLVAASGAAEIGCAGALLLPATRPAAGLAAAALFVAVFPANVSMAVAARRRSWRYRALVYARLPLQAPLVGWAWQVSRQARQR